MEKWFDEAYVAGFVQRAKAGGYSDEQIRAHVAAKRAEAQQAGLTAAEPSPVTGRDVVRSAVGQGALMGFGDEIVGAGAALVPGGHGYTEARDESRAANERFRADHPRLSTGLEIGGGVAGALVPGVGAARAIQGMRAAPGLMRATGAAMGTGAAVGAADALGRSEADLTQGEVGGAAGDVAIGAGAGAAAGALTIPLAKLGGVVISRLRRAAWPVRDAERAAREILAMANEPQGMQRAIARLEELEAMRPGQVVFADASPSMARFADYAANINPAVTDDAAEALGRRGAGAGERMARGVESAIGGRPNARAAARQSRDELRTLGREVYGPLRESGIAMQSDMIDEILTRPEIADMVPPLMRRARAGGRDFVPIVEKIDTPEGFRWQRTGAFPDFDVLQSLKIKLDGQATALQKAGRTGEAQDIISARDDLVAAMEQMVPGYVEANARYGAKLAEQRAFLNGFRALDLDSDEIREMMADASRRGGTPAVAAFRTGMLDKLVKRLRSVQQGHDAAARYANAGRELEEKLRLAFPSQESFDRFMREALAERDLMRTSRRIGQGSPTQPRQAMEELVGAGAGEANLVGATANGGLAGAAAHLGGRMLAGGGQQYKQEVAGEIGDALLLRPWRRTAQDLTAARAGNIARSRRDTALRIGGAGSSGLLMNRLIDSLGD